MAPPLKPNSKWVLAYLVELGNGGAGVQSAGSASTIDPTASPARASTTITSSSVPAARRPASVHARRKLTELRESPDPVADAASDASLASSTSRQTPQTLSSGDSMGHGDSSRGIGSGVSGSGSGTGGSGFDAGVMVAHAEYGMNPVPLYPASARRREQQGTVTLRVQVGADGSVMRVELAESSGYAALDDAALQSVRARWRFVPARRGAVPFKSWVLVPIRFALVD